MTTLIYQGEVTTRGRLLLRGSAQACLAVAWLMVFLILPSLVLARLAFAERGPYGEILWQWTFGNFARLAGFGILGWSPNYVLILLRSLWVGAVTTALSLLLAYPTAFFIATRPPQSRYLWLALAIIPSCTNMVIRAFAWMMLLSQGMAPARLMQWLGLIPEGTALYPGPMAVYIGMLSSFLPFAILPLYTSIERLNWSVVEAAQDLYGSRWRVFYHGVLCQTWPGLKAALILTFIPAIGVFVVPDLLGGSKYMLMGNVIQQQFSASRDWPFGAALCFGLMALTLAGLFALDRGNGGEARAEL